MVAQERKDLAREQDAGGMLTKKDLDRREPKPPNLGHDFGSAFRPFKPGAKKQ